MPAKLLGEKEVGDAVQREILAELESLRKNIKQVPGLAVIVVGEDPASLSVARGEEELGEKLGFHVEIHRLPSTVSVEEICAVIRQLNRAEQIHGLFCRQPLPRRLSEKIIFKAIAPNKDVGGMHPQNAGSLWDGGESFLPCGAYGCLEALKFINRPIQGKTAALIGYSNIVNRPLALLLLRENATVTMCPVLADDLPGICRSADILVTEAGKPGLVRGGWIKPGATVIDAGVTLQGGDLTGDVVLKEAQQVAEWVVPFRATEMGTLTLTMLMKNTLKAFKKKVAQ